MILFKVFVILAVVFKKLSARRKLISGKIMNFLRHCINLVTYSRREHSFSSLSLGLPRSGFMKCFILVPVKKIDEL